MKYSCYFNLKYIDIENRQTDGQDGRRDRQTDKSCTIYNLFCFQGFLGKNYFIATQSPLPNTVDDFWRLVHEQKSSVIVLLNNVKDGTVSTLSCMGKTHLFLLRLLSLSSPFSNSSSSSCECECEYECE